MTKRSTKEKHLDKKPTPTDAVNALSYYVKDIILEEYRKNRKPLEKKWQKNIDAFNSISNGEWADPTWKEGEGQGWRSKTFIQATKVKTVMAWAMVTDIVLQGGKIPFNIAISPWDDLNMEDMAKEERDPIEKAMQEQKDLIDQQFIDCNADRVFVKNILSMAIYGETIASKYIYPVVRKGFKKVSFQPQKLQPLPDEMATQGPVPEQALEQSAPMEDQGQSPMSQGISPQQVPDWQQPQLPQTPKPISPEEQAKYTRYEPFEIILNSPGWGYVSNWNFFHDLECDDLQRGTACIEVDFVSPYELRKEKGEPFWIDYNIDAAISNAMKPGGAGIPDAKNMASIPPALRDLKSRRNTMQRIVYWGRVPRKIADQFEADVKSKTNSDLVFDIDTENDGDEVEIMAVVVDGFVCRYARNKEGERPYYRAEWEMSLDDIGASGVPDNVETMQRILNGMFRAYEDNKKLSANIILAVIRRMMPDWDGSITPGMNIEVAEETDDVRKAIQQVIIQDVGESLLSGIGLAERYLDEGSMMPKIMQGSVLEKQKPDTLGELTMLKENAGKYLGSVIKNIDEGLIEPIVTSYYHYNMSDPDQTKGKGNFVGRATGFSSFQDRIQRFDNIMKALQLSLSSPQLGQETNFRPMLEDVHKALDLEPNITLKTPEQKAQDQKAMAEQQQIMTQQAMEQMMGKMRIEMQAKFMQMEQQHKYDMEKMAAEAIIEDSGPARLA